MIGLRIGVEERRLHCPLTDSEVRLSLAAFGPATDADTPGSFHPVACSGQARCGMGEALDRTRAETIGCPLPDTPYLEW